MNTRIFLTSAGFAVLLSTSAMAGMTNISQLPSEGNVTISGVVESVNNEREFTIRDKTGSIGVDLAAGQSLTLKKGDHVTVHGEIDDKFVTKDINAKNVDVDKDLAEGVSDAIKSIPGVSTRDATAYNISQLPEKGMVKVSGVVTDVDNAKEFTLKDDTGSVNIDVESSENAALAEGARVTVIGKVDSGIMGKDINANRVIVTANAKSSRN